MKFSFILLFLCYTYSVAAIGAQCSIDLPNCQLCDANYTHVCLQCQSNYDLDNTKGQCFLCTLQNCNICRTPTLCKVCDQSNNYALNFATGLCQICGITGCNKCQTTTECRQCLPSYTLYIPTGLCIPCNVVGCQKGCAIPNVCLDSVACGQNDTRVISPLNTNQIICIACNIQNCIECVRDNYCRSCNQTIVNTLSPDILGKTCIKCDVSDCAICSQPDVCAFCLYPTELNALSNKCVFCNVENCLQCQMFGVCKTCIDEYAISQTGSCILCPVQCLTCLSNGQCITCKQPKFNLLPSTHQNDLGKCFQMSVSNCIAQDRNNHTQCLSCNPHFQLNYDRTQCITQCDKICLTCSSYNECLSCRNGFYHTNKTCKLCPKGCEICTSATSCTKVLIGFFKRIDGSIGVCQKNCKNCQNQTVCNQLQNYNGVANFKDQNGQTQILICTKNCKRCQNSQKCIDCKQGFYLKKDKEKDRQGICFSCDPTCKECDKTDPTICLSCPDHYFLNNKKCTSCDNNCLTCKDISNRTVCTSCQNGHWLHKYMNKCIFGCPNNCLSCSSYSDCSICNSGYTTQLDKVKDSATYDYVICTPCVVSCRLCAAGKPSSCIDCGDGFYKLNDKCIACQENCKTCTYQQCTECFENFQLVLKETSTNSRVCAPQCIYPCSQCTIEKPTQCSKCIAGYTLNGNICVPKLQCSGQRGCFICPTGSVLNNGVCTACSTVNCQKCLTQNINTCLLCEIGYYLDSNNCSRCPLECKDCYSPQECIKCSDGYVLINKRIKRGYQCVKCDPKCKTCINNQNKCTSCVNGYQLIGWKCDAIFKISMIHEFDCTLNQFHNQSRTVIYLFLGGLGVSNFDFFSFLNVELGSVILKSSIQIPGGSGTQTATDAYYEIKNVGQSGRLGRLTVISSNIILVGGVLYSPSSHSSNSDLAIILGICIPSVILIVFGIIMFRRRSQKSLRSVIIADSTIKIGQFQ